MLHVRGVAQARVKLTLLSYSGSTSDNDDWLTSVLATTAFFPTGSELCTAKLASRYLPAIQTKGGSCKRERDSRALLEGKV